MNTWKELIKLAGNETIEAISVGEKSKWDELSKPTFYSDYKQAKNQLDFEFDSDYGGEEGYSIYAWTKNWVIVKGVYDGLEWYTKIPRNPSKDCIPTSIGGW